MAGQLFANVQVADIPATRTFWSSLGFAFNEQFCSQDTLCLVLGPDAFAMLLAPTSFARFLPGTAASDPTRFTEVLLAVSLDSREDVDTLYDGVIAAGGSQARATEDLGFMYTRSFRDLDGHLWEPFFFDTELAARQWAEGEAAS